MIYEDAGGVAPGWPQYSKIVLRPSAGPQNVRPVSASKMCQFFFSKTMKEIIPSIIKRFKFKDTVGPPDIRRYNRINSHVTNSCS
jgi:hypothetical protein